MDRTVVWSAVSLVTFLVGMDLGISKKWAECPPRNGQDPLISLLRHANGETTCTYMETIEGRVYYKMRVSIQ